MSSQIYYNPSCSKCRSALAILEEHHIEADVVRYLDIAPTRADLAHLMGLLGIDDPRLMMRTGEAVYTELALDEKGPADLLDAIVAHPSSWSGRSSSTTGGRSSAARPSASSICSEWGPGPKREARGPA
jgi:arsenate reductase